jgi:hypothetical protein
MDFFPANASKQQSRPPSNSVSGKSPADRHAKGNDMPSNAKPLGQLLYRAADLLDGYDAGQEVRPFPT